MKKIILALSLFILSSVFVAFPQKSLAGSKSCSVSLSQNSVVVGDKATANYSGSGDTTKNVDLYIVKWPDGGTISPTPGALATYLSQNYYKIASCPANGSACPSVSIGNLPRGSYYIFCQIAAAPDACSGNPFCSYEGVGGTQNCGASGWQSCSGSDHAFFGVNPLPGESYFTGDLTEKFKETETLHLTSPSQIKYFFTLDHRVPQQGALPPQIVFSGSSVTFKDKGGVAVENPLKDEPFYKVEVTLADTNQQNLTGYLTMIDNWWNYQTFTNGMSAGINTAETKSTYWWWHTEFKNKGQIPDSQYYWSMQRINRFVKRKVGDTKIVIYVTPIGSYVVVNDANFASFPNLYIGSYTYKNKNPLNFIVLGKWNSGGDPVTFKDLRIVKLDNSIANIDEVNAYFIKRTVESDTFKQTVSSSQNFNGADNFANSLWSAFLYRAYDYYFRTNHEAQVQQLVDYYLAYLPTYVDQNVSRYGRESTLNINHSFISSIQSNPLIVYAISGYLRSDQKQKLQSQFARIIDTSEQYIKTDGSFPASIQYKADTFGEEISWLLSFYTGYYVDFPNDLPRSEKLLDYITFLGFHHLSTGKSIRQVYGDTIKFKYLGSNYLDFVSEYIWPDGSIDNHNFHPSLNYAQGLIGTAAFVNDILTKKGIQIPTVTNNLGLAYTKVIKENLDITTFHLKHTNPEFTDANYQNLAVLQDNYTLAADGSAVDLVGYTNPSFLEDWANTFTNYSVIEDYGDYPLADAYAKNVYYGYYSGAGKLFCGHVDVGNGQKCSASTANFYNYQFSDALISLLFSSRSRFDPQLGPSGLGGDYNADGQVNILDLNQLLANFTNVYDYNLIVTNFGKTE